MEVDSQKDNDSSCYSLNENDINIFSFHNDEHVENNLLGLIMEIGAPNYAYKKL